MTNTLDRLKTAIADLYTIESELGRGGMAIVFLAEDIKLRRQVAIKVLRPELSASLGFLWGAGCRVQSLRTPIFDTTARGETLTRTDHGSQRMTQIGLPPCCNTTGPPTLKSRSQRGQRMSRLPVNSAARISATRGLNT